MILQIGLFFLRQVMSRGGICYRLCEKGQGYYACFMIHNLWPTGWISHPLDHAPGTMIEPGLKYIVGPIRAMEPPFNSLIKLCIIAGLKPPSP